MTGGGVCKGRADEAFGISRLPGDDEAGLANVLAIYRDAIEPSEQKPLEELRALVTQPEYEVLVARRDGVVAGFAILMFPSTREFWLLEYMAVDRTRRSSGLGAALLRAANDAGARRLPGAPGVLEVDRQDARVAKGNEVARRLQFYARQGCRTVDGLIYELPLEAGGTPPAMQLLVQGLDEVDAVPVDTVKRWLTTLYVEVYGCDASDPRIESMLATAGDTFALRPLLS